MSKVLRTYKDRHPRTSDSLVDSKTSQLVAWMNRPAHLRERALVHAFSGKEFLPFLSKIEVLAYPLLPQGIGGDVQSIRRGLVGEAWQKAR